MNYSESFGLTYLKDRSLSYRNHPVGLSNMQSKNYISGANYTRVSIKTHGIMHMYCYSNSSVTRGGTLYFREHSMKVWNNTSF